MRTVIAFDVSKGKSIAVAYEESGKFLLETNISHTRTGFQKLLEIILELIENYGKQPEIVFEATGVYSRALERFLQDYDYAYILLNPLEAKYQTQTLRRNKTDKNDAYILAKTHFKQRRSPKAKQSNYHLNMKAISRRYDEIEEEKNKYKNRLHALLQLSFPEIDALFKSKSMMFYRVVQLFPHPSLIKNKSKTIVKNRLKKCTNKNYSLKKLEERAVELIEAAKDSYPAIDFNDYECTLITQYAETLLKLEDKQKQLINKMEALSKNKNEFKVLMSFPGIQKTTACRLIAELGDLSRFQNNKQLNAYTGIDIARYQSGETQYKDRINKRGNKRLRSILFFMVVSMLGTNNKGKNHIVDYYYKLKSQPYNKHHKVATIACMNKFLKVVFHLIQNNILYNYEAATAQ